MHVDDGAVVVGVLRVAVKKREREKAWGKGRERKLREKGDWLELPHGELWLVLFLVLKVLLKSPLVFEIFARTPPWKLLDFQKLYIGPRSQSLQHLFSP